MSTQAVSELRLRMIEDMIARDTPWLMDFGFGDGEYKRRFCTRQTLSAGVLLLPRTWRAESLVLAAASRIDDDRDAVAQSRHASRDVETVAAALGNDRIASVGVPREGKQLIVLSTGSVLLDGRMVF